jgi:hypothetical protein
MFREADVQAGILLPITSKQIWSIFMRNNENYRCRVCGLTLDCRPWGEDGKNPTFMYCYCCGVEFGYTDATPAAIKKFRLAWLAKGAPWAMPEFKPENWDLNEQLKSIPEEFR